MLGWHAIGDAVQQADEAAGVADGLVKPQHGLARPRRVVLLGVGLVVCQGSLGGFCDGEEPEEGVAGPGDQCQQVLVGDGVDVVEGDGGAEPEAVRELGSSPLGCFLGKHERCSRVGF